MRIRSVKLNQYQRLQLVAPASLTIYSPAHYAITASADLNLYFCSRLCSRTLPQRNRRLYGMGWAWRTSAFTYLSHLFACAKEREGQTRADSGPWRGARYRYLFSHRAGSRL